MSFFTYFYCTIFAFKLKSYNMKGKDEIDDMKIRRRVQKHFKKYDQILEFLLASIIIGFVLLIFIVLASQ